MRSNINNLAKTLRLPASYGKVPTVVDAQGYALSAAIAAKTAHQLESNYRSGFGVFPSADPDSNYYNQLWARDLAHAAGNYFAEANPKALEDSFETLFNHQREDGSLPSRVEREYLIVKFIPFLKPWSKQIFDLIEKKIRGRSERPVYEGQEGLGGEDTIPAVIIGVGEFFLGSTCGNTFVKDYFDCLNRAVDLFRKKTDPLDGLAVMTRSNPDWADTITRKGKLGGINVWWARSLRLMQHMASSLGCTTEATRYKEEGRKVKKNVLAKLYNQAGGYFQAEEKDDRLDTVASIFGALYLLGPQEAVRVERALTERVERPMGLQNFDPPYPENAIRWKAEWSYHNQSIWPWVTCENIQVKIKIALQHPDPAIKSQYQREAVQDLFKIANLFEKGGGAGEIFDPNVPRLAKTKSYTPPTDFMGSMAAYQGAYLQLKKLGWI